MIRAKELITENEKYGANRKVFENLSDFTKEQIRKEYKEWLENNADDFQEFDEFVCRWYEEEPEFFKETYPNWNEEKGKYYVPDGFENEEEKAEFLKNEKEAFIDGILDSFDCGYPLFAFQDSSYYNMYLFVEPNSSKFKEGAYSLFQANSYCYLSNDFIFTEDETEEALYSVSPDDWEEDFVEFGKMILKEVPNADMEKISNWISENDLEAYMDEAEIRDGVLFVDDKQMELVA